MTSNSLPFWSGILATLVGGILAIGGWFVPNTIERCQERKSVRAALRSEIQSILTIVERRNYICQLSGFVEAIRAGSPNFFQRRIGKDYNLVFRNNCNKLGLLSSETAAKIVRFYSLVSSVVLDVSLLQDDSLGLIRLVVFLENGFGYRIEDEELIADNFATLRSLGELLATKTPTGPTAEAKLPGAGGTLGTLAVLATGVVLLFNLSASAVIAHGFDACAQTSEQANRSCLEGAQSNYVNALG